MSDNDRGGKHQRRGKPAGSPVSSCGSVKSDGSMGIPPTLSCGPSPSSTPSLSEETALPTQMMLDGTGNLQQDSYQPADDGLQRVLTRHKTSLKNKYENLFEGVKSEENKTFLNRIYTTLYIIEGEGQGVNKEHEIHIARKHLQGSPISCSDIFDSLQGPKRESGEHNTSVKGKKIKDGGEESKEQKVQNLRTVMTKGIPGIGKTVSVQKFILDWAEGEASQDVDFMFVLPFRELNLIKDDQYSLHGLLCDFHPEIKYLDLKRYDVCKTVFIFDGLDESRIPLNFEQCEKVSDITMTSSVGALMMNLIRGDLLPSARIWITSRPAAANQIPPQHIDRVTEIQGFSDPQKDEYFRKRISDEDQAERIMSHIKKARSLHIMCHIPVFCWISATVLQKIIREHHSEIPQTLTEMYSHFLLTQINMKNQKYEEKEERDPKNLLEFNRSMLLKLAELAFKQLMKGNVMFYEEDLRECGIDVTEASVCSGIFIEIFREEHVLHQSKVYSFVHLSFQEFLAAVYVFHCFESKNMKVLRWFILYTPLCENVMLEKLLKGAVDKALENKNGHLDLFLRFLLGISLESNQKLLLGLLTQTHSSSESISKTSQYIKDKIQKLCLPSESYMNLFLCLSEMNDQSLSSEIQEYLNSEKHSDKKLSPGQCSVLACMLLTSEEVLDELDLNKFNTSLEGYRRLVPALSICRKALLAGCNVSTYIGETLASALRSVNSSLKELDLSNNDLQDSGVELLSAGLKSPHCKLKTLRLSLNHLGNKACEALGSALQSVNPFLKELDLSNNDLQDSGVELLSAGLKSSHCKLEKLRLSGCMITEEGCSSLAAALQSNPSHLRELDLTYNHPGESGVNVLSDLLEDSNCALEKLQMEHGGEIRMQPGLKKYACRLTLDPNTASSLLSLSEGNRKVEFVWEFVLYPHHPDRFDGILMQVLCRESLTGRCYWEAEWSEKEAGRSGTQPVWSIDPEGNESKAEWNIMVEQSGNNTEGSGNKIEGYRDKVEGRRDKVEGSEDEAEGSGNEEECTLIQAGMSVSYRGINREDSEDAVFGCNKLSWMLQCVESFHSPEIIYMACHDNKRTTVPFSQTYSRRVGVYLDMSAGTLSFYSIAPSTHTLGHIHTFRTIFTEPLYAGFWVFKASVHVCEPE